MNAPIVAIRLLLPAALLVAACGVQPHPTVSANGTAGTDAVSGAAGTTGQGGTDTSGAAGISGSAGTFGAAGTMGAGGSIDPAGRGGASGPSGSGGQAGSRGGTSGGSTAGSSGTGTAGTSGAGTAGTGGTGTSGAGITINGTFVPKEKAITFIHFGHSNMRGQATKPSSLMTYFYSTQAGLWSYKGSFALAKEPTAPEGTMTLAGPGMAILHSAQGALQAGSDAQIISIGYGKGSVTTVDYAKTGVYYPIFMNWAQQLKGKVTFAGIVVMLGITERHLPTDQISGYPARMAAIIASIRSDLGEPNLPVLFCDYEQGATGDLAPTGSVGTVIQPLTRMLPQMIQNLVLVPTDGLSMQDDHHFDMQGHKDWAARVIMLMQSKGWWRW
jgi:Carbohydrate esterase, sialic acid-specific acetylesterase